MTVREYTSKITNKLKALGIDDWISTKFIFNEVKSIVSDFVKKDNSGSRLLYKINDSFTEIEGLPMIEVDSTVCGIGVYDCNRMMRSKEPLPAIHMSKFGPLVTEIMSVNFGTTYKNANTPRQWKAIQKREFKDDTKYYFFIENHLFIPLIKASEPSPEEIRILAMFKDKWEVEQYKMKVGTCEECKKTNSCKRPLDFPIVIPSYLEDDVEAKLMTDLANAYLKIIPDSMPDMDNSSKNNSRIIQQQKQKA